MSDGEWRFAVVFGFGDPLNVAEDVAKHLGEEPGVPAPRQRHLELPLKRWRYFHSGCMKDVAQEMERN